LADDFKILHEFSEGERNEVVSLANQLKQSFKESFSRISNGYSQSRQELATIRRRLKAAEVNEEDPIIAADRARKEQLEREVIRLEDEMMSIDREIGQLQEQQKVKQRQYSELTKRLDASKVDREKDQRLTRHIAQLRKFISRFQDNKKKSLEEAILIGLQTLMHKKGFIHAVDVKILGEDIDINLLNQQRQMIPKESLSKGEQQMYATALLRGLVEESRIEFPVFIDSPMQKFDEQHAENIVRFFYPTIADQVILFPLVNKEMNSKEYSLLSPHIARTYLIHNVQAERSEFMEVAPSQFLKTYNQLYNSPNGTE
jgi:DNA sulfur modification protein DndD